MAGVNIVIVLFTAFSDELVLPGKYIHIYNCIPHLYND